MIILTLYPLYSNSSIFVFSYSISSNCFPRINFGKYATCIKWAPNERRFIRQHLNGRMRNGIYRIIPRSILVRVVTARRGQYFTFDKRNYLPIIKSCSFSLTFLQSGIPFIPIPLTSRFKTAPVPNTYSHIHDVITYICIHIKAVLYLNNGPERPI